MTQSPDVLTEPGDGRAVLDADVIVAGTGNAGFCAALAAAGAGLGAAAVPHTRQ